jgi:flagellar basal-body rod protein FlgC
MHIAASGMKVQSDRLRIVAQNIANVNSTGEAPGSDPYRRKVVSFENQLDRELGAELVEISKYGEDDSPFPLVYDPSHPAANAEGYYKSPNINPMIELIDMREARRAYEANINITETTKTMLTQTVNMLR